jgi:hypothetical protein
MNKVSAHPHTRIAATTPASMLNFVKLGMQILGGAEAAQNPNYSTPTCTALHTLRATASNPQQL